MSIVKYDTLEGKLIIKEKPINLCWTTPLDFFKAIIDYITVSFPIEANNKFVITGRDTPSADDVDKMWARQDANRNFLGWHSYIKGSWKRVYEYRSDEVIWMLGNSSNIPEGFQLLDGNVPGLSTNIVNKLEAQYVETSVGSGVYTYFAVRFIGY